jgi:hypothetical protein
VVAKSPKRKYLLKRKYIIASSSTICHGAFKKIKKEDALSWGKLAAGHLRILSLIDWCHGCNVGFVSLLQGGESACA